jgi:hypothetical protein
VSSGGTMLTNKVVSSGGTMLTNSYFKLVSMTTKLICADTHKPSLVVTVEALIHAFTHSRSHKCVFYRVALLHCLC